MGVLGMNRCMSVVIGSPGEAKEELNSPYHCSAGRAGGVMFFAVIIRGDNYAQRGCSET